MIEPFPNPLIEVHWQTPIGTMSGQIGPLGSRALSFSSPQNQRLPEKAVQKGTLTAIFQNDSHDGMTPPPIPAIVEQTTRFLDDYFQRRPPRCEPPLDWSGCGAFDQQVWKAARRLGLGQTTTYGDLAERIGRPGAARAVGGALGRNPLVLLTPCHRVLAKGTGARRLGGFSGGLPLKGFLLAWEGVNDIPSIPVGG